MGVRDSIKQALLAVGRYRRALGQARLPGVAVLGYHGLRDDSWPAGAMPFENLHVRASTFAAHCHVIRETCHPISLDDWRAAEAGERPLPDRPVLITFDDGYRSVLTIAAPILAQLELPAVVFACSAPIRTRTLLWFDHVAAVSGEAAVEPWKARSYDEWAAAWGATAPVADEDPRALMTQADVAALARQPGIEIGAHTARHPVLSRASDAQQREEIVICRDELSDWTGAPVRAFAYPNGRPGIDYTSRTVAIVRDLGFDMAFAMRSAFARVADLPLERPRFLMLSDVSDAELAHRLAYTWPR